MIGEAIQVDLFNSVYPPPPRTEGVKYAGSKLKLLPQILSLVGKTGARRVFDGFSGSTRVSQALAKSGYEVVANDRAVWSGVFGQCYLQSDHQGRYQRLIDHLNACSPEEGWFTQHYGGDSRALRFDQKKMPWQVHNTRKLDAIRREIDRLSLEPSEKAVAITSLILALDQVDSTLGHFSSYLREWSPRSYKDMHLVVPKIVSSGKKHVVYTGDVFDVAEAVDADIAYYDPPYGSNNEKMPPSRVRYAAYYHIWTTICLNDCPRVFGKANRRVDTRDGCHPSVFEEFRRDPHGKFIAVEAISRLIESTNTRYILMSYSSGGRATAEQLQSAMSKAGQLIKYLEVDYKRNVMSGMRWTNEWLKDDKTSNREYLFLMERK